MNGWLEAFAAHPAIGRSTPAAGHGSKISAQLSQFGCIVIWCLICFWFFCVCNGVRFRVMFVCSGV